MSNRPPGDRSSGGSSNPHDVTSTYKVNHEQTGSRVHRGYPYPQDPGTRYTIPAYQQQQAPTYAMYREQQQHQGGDVRYPYTEHAEYQHLRQRPTMLPAQHFQMAPMQTAMQTNQPVDSDRSRDQLRYKYDPPTAVVPLGSTAALDSSTQHVSKRPKLTLQPLRVDVREPEIKREPAYTPQVEAISPTLPTEDNNASKEILSLISKVDKDIANVEGQISKLKKKQQQLEEASAKPPEERPAIENLPTFDTNSQQSIAQLIYAENRRKAEQSHSVFDKLGPQIELPLYNQPSDTIVYRENKRNYQMFKKRLVLFFKKRQQARKIRERYLTERYDQLMQTWLKKMERIENNVKRRAKDARIREFYEKIFPEVKKTREDKERFSRVGSRNLGGIYARSEAELEQIMDGLHEQEEEDKKMRSDAVIPPMMLDARQRKLRFNNTNGLIEDPMAEYKERQNINVWTAQEKHTFKEKYLQHPKNFTMIASYLERKSVADCVQYYYDTKRTDNYKQLLRKQNVKKRRQMQKAQAQMMKEEPKDEMPLPIEMPPVTQEDAPGENLVCEAPQAVPASVTASTKLEGGAHKCVICQCDLEHYGLSRPLTKANCELYGLDEADLHPDMRVCSSCRCRSVRKRYTHCPIPSCKTPKRKVKRLRPLPSKWLELPPSEMAAIAKDLLITETVTKCCSACFNRIARRLGTSPSTNQTTAEATNMDADTNSNMVAWSQEEINLMKQCLATRGRDWSYMATILGAKTELQCKTFYYNSSDKQAYDYIVQEYKKSKVERQSSRTVSTCESVASTVTAHSDDDMSSSDDDERDDSDTTSAPSPSPLNNDDDIKSPKKEDIGASDAAAVPQVSVGDTVTARVTSRGNASNDSNATMSADESLRSQDSAPSAAKSQRLMTRDSLLDDQMAGNTPKLLTDHERLTAQQIPGGNQQLGLRRGAADRSMVELYQQAHAARHNDDVGYTSSSQTNNQRTNGTAPAQLPDSSDNHQRKSKPACVGDLIHSAIETNLRKDYMETENTNNSNDARMRLIVASDEMQRSDRGTAGTQHAYSFGGQYGTVLRGSDGHEYGAAPHDMSRQQTRSPVSYRSTDQQQKMYAFSDDQKGFPPPAHSHHPQAPQDTAAHNLTSGRHAKSPMSQTDRGRHLPYASPSESGRPSPRTMVPPPNKSPKVPTSQPTSSAHLPTGSITHGTPVGHSRPPQVGSITRGTPMNRENVPARPSQTSDPNMVRVYDHRVMYDNANQIRATAPQVVYDRAALEQFYKLSGSTAAALYPAGSVQVFSNYQQDQSGYSRATIMSDFYTAQQMQRHHDADNQKSPRPSEQMQKAYPVADPRMPPPSGLIPYSHTVIPGQGIVYIPTQGAVPVTVPERNRTSPAATPPQASPRKSPNGSTVSHWQQQQQQQQHLAIHLPLHPGSHLIKPAQISASAGPSIVRGTSGRRNPDGQTKPEHLPTGPLPDSTGVHHHKDVSPGARDAFDTLATVAANAKSLVVPADALQCYSPDSRHRHPADQWQHLHQQGTNTSERPESRSSKSEGRTYAAADGRVLWERGPAQQLSGTSRTDPNVKRDPYGHTKQSPDPASVSAMSSSTLKEKDTSAGNAPDTSMTGANMLDAIIQSRITQSDRGGDLGKYRGVTPPASMYQRASPGVIDPSRKPASRGYDDLHRHRAAVDNEATPAAAHSTSDRTQDSPPSETSSVPTASQKGLPLTLGEHIDAIITNDYSHKHRCAPENISILRQLNIGATSAKSPKPTLNATTTQSDPGHIAETPRPGSVSDSTHLVTTSPSIYHNWKLKRALQQETDPPLVTHSLIPEPGLRNLGAHPSVRVSGASPMSYQKPPTATQIPPGPAHLSASHMPGQSPSSQAVNSRMSPANRQQSAAMDYRQIPDHRVQSSDPRAHTPDHHRPPRSSDPRIQSSSDHRVIYADPRAADYRIPSSADHRLSMSDLITQRIQSSGEQATMSDHRASQQIPDSRCPSSSDNYVQSSDHRSHSADADVHSSDHRPRSLSDPRANLSNSRPQIANPRGLIPDARAQLSDRRTPQLDPHASPDAQYYDQRAHHAADSKAQSCDTRYHGNVEHVQFIDPRINSSEARPKSSDPRMQPDIAHQQSKSPVSSSSSSSADYHRMQVSGKSPNGSKQVRGKSPTGTMQASGKSTHGPKDQAGELRGIIESNVQAAKAPLLSAADLSVVARTTPPLPVTKPTPPASTSTGSNIAASHQHIKSLLSTSKQTPLPGVSHGEGMLMDKMSASEYAQSKATESASRLQVPMDSSAYLRANPQPTSPGLHHTKSPSPRPSSGLRGDVYPSSSVSRVGFDDCRGAMATNVGMYQKPQSSSGTHERTESMHHNQGTSVTTVPPGGVQANVHHASQHGSRSQYDHPHVQASQQQQPSQQNVTRMQHPSSSSNQQYAYSQMAAMSQAAQSAVAHSLGSPQVSQVHPLASQYHGGAYKTPGSQTPVSSAQAEMAESSTSKVNHGVSCSAETIGQSQRQQSEAYDVSSSATPSNQESPPSQLSAQGVTPSQMTPTSSQQMLQANMKKRMFSRTRFRVTAEAQDGGVSSLAGKNTQLTATDENKFSQATSSDGNVSRSEYDFPDEDDETLGKPLVSYMALSSTTRSPRRNVVVESSDVRVETSSQATSASSDVASSLTTPDAPDNQVSSGSSDHVQLSEQTYMESDNRVSSGGYDAANNPSRSESSTNNEVSSYGNHEGWPRPSYQHQLLDINEARDSRGSIDSTMSDGMVIDESDDIGSSTNVNTSTDQCCSSVMDETREAGSEVSSQSRSSSLEAPAHSGSSRYSHSPLDKRAWPEVAARSGYADSASQYEIGVVNSASWGSSYGEQVSRSGLGGDNISQSWSESNQSQPPESSVSTSGAQRTRSPRILDAVYGSTTDVTSGLAAQSTSDIIPSALPTGAASSTSSEQTQFGHQHLARDQEPIPLLSSMYETLSDDDED